MKSKLLAAILVIFAASSATAFANDEHHDAPKAETVKTEKAEVKKPVKKHSHMEEKTGVPMPAPATGTSNEMSKDMHEHMHNHMKEH